MTYLLWFCLSIWKLRELVLGKDLWMSFDVSVKPLKLCMKFIVHESEVCFIFLLGRRCAAFTIVSDGVVTHKKLRTV